VLSPSIVSRVEKATNRSGLWVDSGNIRPLVAVAVSTRESEVAGVGGAAMLLRNDMIDLEGD
jgi:hypothetical protein